MIKLKPKTRKVLEKILEAIKKRKEYGALYKKNAEVIKTLYVVDDIDAYKRHKEEEKIIKKQRWAEIKNLFESKISQKEYATSIEQINEKYDKLFEELPKYKKYIPEDRRPEFQILERDNSILLELSNSVDTEERHLIDILEDTVIEEYNLKKKFAKIGVYKNAKQKLYYNSVLSADERNLSEIYTSLLNTSFDFIDCVSKEIGLCAFFEDYSHLKSFCEEESKKPNYLIEVSLDPKANIHYLDYANYKEEDYKDYEQLFVSEDYRLLDDVQKDSFGYYRYLFDIASGYDATVITYPDSDKKLYAIYNRSILEINPQSIKSIEEVLGEESLDK